jgi:hypothetical protein
MLLVQSARVKGLSLQKRLERTVMVVFVTLSCRAIFAVMFAVGFLQFDQSPDCLVCEECQTETTAMGAWFIEYPGFHAITNMLAAPVALLFALFGALLSKSDLRLLLKNSSPGTKLSTNNDTSERSIMSLSSTATATQMNSL